MRSTLILSVAGLAALSSAMPTTTVPPHHTPNYGPTSSLHAHSTSAAYSQPNHGPKPSDLVWSLWSYIASHIPRPSHTSHPYGTHTKPGPKPMPTCIYHEPGDDYCEPIPRPHHVVPKYTSSSMSRSGHGSYGSASHSHYVPKTVSSGPYPTSEVTHKPHSPKKTSSSAPHPSYARRDLHNDEEKPPCRPINPRCGFHSHPTYVPTGHSTFSYAPNHTPEYTSSVAVSSTYSSKSRHPPKLTFSHAPWPTYSSKGHSASSYAPKHTSQPAHIHPQEPPKYPYSTASSAATYPHSTLKYTTSSAHHSHHTPDHSTHTKPYTITVLPPSPTGDPCEDCRPRDNAYHLPLPTWCDYIDCPAYHPTSTKKHAPSYPTASNPKPHGPKPEPLPPCGSLENPCPRIPIDLWCHVEHADWPDCLTAYHHPTSTKKHAPSYPTVTSYPEPYVPEPPRPSPEIDERP